MSPFVRVTRVTVSLQSNGSPKTSLHLYSALTWLVCCGAGDGVLSLVYTRPHSIKSATSPGPVHSFPMKLHSFPLFRFDTPLPR